MPGSVLPLRTRADAERDDVVGALNDAALIFFSGGNPWRLSEMVKGTPFWARLLARMGDGLAYVGCSAGVASLTDRSYRRRNGDNAAEGEIADPRVYRMRLSMMFGIDLTAEEVAALGLFGN